MMRSAVLLACLLALLNGIWVVAYIPVAVMLPLDAISNKNELQNPAQLLSRMKQLKQVGVDGVMTDVWWGLVERKPTEYNWTAYNQLVDLVIQANLTLKAIMSFHQCGGNVGDTCDIPLPSWIANVSLEYPNIYYTDIHGNRNAEYLTWGVDNQAIFPPNNRTAVQMYTGYMKSFAANFAKFLGTVISEVQIGLGPAGEMRYPSYPLSRWNFPGVGEFQCYDSYLLADLKAAANKAGQPLWGNGGPNNAGNYNSYPWDTGFFNDGFENFASPYGQFFLNWYAGGLIQHGDVILQQASSIFKGKVNIAAKVSGIHWMYKHKSHAAELTAGYKNDLGRAYYDITAMFAKHGAAIDFTCLEMRDSQQPDYCLCGPEELVYSTLVAAHSAKIGYSGENALPVYDTYSYDQIKYESTRVAPIEGFDYLRMSDTLMESGNLATFGQFVQNMHN